MAADSDTVGGGMPADTPLTTSHRDTIRLHTADRRQLARRAQMAADSDTVGGGMPADTPLTTSHRDTIRLHTADRQTTAGEAGTDGGRLGHGRGRDACRHATHHVSQGHDKNRLYIRLSGRRIMARNIWCLFRLLKCKKNTKRLSYEEKFNRDTWMTQYLSYWYSIPSIITSFSQTRGNQLL